MKKLSLTRETLQQLDASQAQAVAGGQVKTYWPCTAVGCALSGNCTATQA